MIFELMYRVEHENRKLYDNLVNARPSVDNKSPFKFGQLKGRYSIPSKNRKKEIEN
jgi:hypothetical protein